MSQQPDLTSQDAVETSQQVYADIVSGQCNDAADALDDAHGVNQ